jgi:hypothetical protein
MKPRVRDHEKFVRDPKNLAILNTDEESLKRHEMKMEQLRKQKMRDEELNMIKNDISELKSMLRELINGRSK